MDIMTADIIAKKSRALKHCNKLLNEIDKNGSTKICLGNTGVTFHVVKNDAIYLNIQKVKYDLLCDIRSYETNIRAEEVTKKSTVRIAPPAPICAARTAEEILANYRAKQREYQRRYLAKKRLLKKS